jgi:hypothetical protein
MAMSAHAPLTYAWTMERQSGINSATTTTTQMVDNASMEQPAEDEDGGGLEELVDGVDAFGGENWIVPTNSDTANEVCPHLRLTCVKNEKIWDK